MIPSIPALASYEGAVSGPDAAPAGAPVTAPTQVGTATSSANLVSVPFTVAGGIAAGVTVLVAAAYRGSPPRTLSAVTDSAGNSYTVDATIGHTISNAVVGIGRCTLSSPIAAAGTITATFTGSPSAFPKAISVATTPSVLSVDQSAGAQDSGAPAAYAAPSMVAAGQPRLLFGVAASSTATSSSPGGSISELADINSGLAMAVGYQVLDSTGNFVFSGTWATAVVWVCAAATYVAA